MRYKIVPQEAKCYDKAVLMKHLDREQFDKFKAEVDYSDSLVLLALTRELECMLTTAINSTPINDFELVGNKENIRVVTQVLSLLPAVKESNKVIGDRKE